jgi:hypothetical protein
MFQFIGGLTARQKAHIMDTVRINNPIESGFARVPNSLWSLPISIDAKAIFAYLLSFRDGSTVRVAFIEKALRIGRDKRRKAMSELEAVGLICRVTERDASGRVLTNEMSVDTLPLLRELLSDLENRGPDIQAPGNRPPEKPAAGNSGGTGVETRRNRGGKSGGLYKTKTIKGAAASAFASKGAKPRPAFPASPLSAVDPSALTRFQRSCVQSDKLVCIAGHLIQPGSPEMDRLRQSLIADLLGWLKAPPLVSI